MLSVSYIHFYIIKCVFNIESNFYSYPSLPCALCPFVSPTLHFTLQTIFFLCFAKQLFVSLHCWFAVNNIWHVQNFVHQPQMHIVVNLVDFSSLKNYTHIHLTKFFILTPVILKMRVQSLLRSLYHVILCKNFVYIYYPRLKPDKYCSFRLNTKCIPARTLYVY